eukprot:2575131-Pleurochrysis_carterae.AAC.4
MTWAHNLAIPASSVARNTCSDVETDPLGETRVRSQGPIQADVSRAINHAQGPQAIFSTSLPAQIHLHYPISLHNFLLHQPRRPLQARTISDHAGDIQSNRSCEMERIRTLARRCRIVDPASGNAELLQRPVDCIDGNCEIVDYCVKNVGGKHVCEEPVYA